MSTWERIERKKLQGRERRARQYRPDDRPDPAWPALRILTAPAGSDQSEFRRYLRYRRRRTRHHLASLGRPLRKSSDVFKRDLQFTTAIYPLGMVSYMAHIRSIERFFADADAGCLPSFCIVDPDFRTFSEENPQDIREGESFAAEVIGRVMHGPGHASPPAAVPPDDLPGHSRVAHPSLARSLTASCRP